MEIIRDHVEGHSRDHVIDPAGSEIHLAQKFLLGDAGEVMKNVDDDLLLSEDSP